MSHRSIRGGAQRRPAFTLVEVLVALTTLGVGLLGLSASAVLVTRMVGDGSRLTVAATVAATRLEMLRALPCAVATSGSAVTRGIEERWTIAPIGAPEEPTALEVELSASYRLRSVPRAGSARTQRFRAALPCP